MTSSYLIPKTEEAKGNRDRKYKRTTVFAFQVSSFSFQHASHTNNHSHLIVNQKALNDGAFFCYCAYVLRISEWSEKVGYLCATHKYAGKADLGKRYWDPKKQLRVTFFSDN